jgi:inosine-uridine nucleoside N-ribohydrolase
VNRCLLVDHDGSFDDLRAITELSCNAKITHIVFTEGITRPSYSHENYLFLKKLFFTSQSVKEYRGIENNRSLNRFWKNVRQRDESLNSYRRQQEFTPKHLDANLNSLVSGLENDCSIIDVIVLGPYTTAETYLPRLIPRLGLIYTFGNSDPKYFNCWYDLQACKTIFSRFNEIIKPVDLPLTDSTGARFSFTHNFVKKLESSRNLKTLAHIFKANSSGWSDKEIAFWDDAVALFYLSPAHFKHEKLLYRPAIDSAALENSLFKLLNMCVL